MYITFGKHFITEDLEKHGGHIEYGIRPSERKKGYSKQQRYVSPNFENAKSD